MKLTSQEKSIAMQAKSVDELINLAKAYGKSISKEEAEEIYTELNKEGELADEELEDVAGGGCYSTDDHGCLIVTWENCCALYQPRGRVDRSPCCNVCANNSGLNSVPMYCLVRRKDYDPLR